MIKFGMMASLALAAGLASKMDAATPVAASPTAAVSPSRLSPVAATPAASTPTAAASASPAAHAAALSPSAQAAALSPTAQSTALSPTAQGAPHKRKHKAAVQAAADAVPDFTLADVNGKNFHLRDHLGEAVLIDFWATWCGPCRMAIPHLIELQTKYKNKGFTVVGISLDQQGPDLVRNFVTTWKVNYPVVIDLDGSVARTYGGVRAIPTTVVIDAQGRVVGDPIVGYRPLEEYESLIRKALKES